jgi:hypothetical protein
MTVKEKVLRSSHFGGSDSLILKKMDAYQKYVRDALEILGKENLALIIHDQSFPSIPDQDTGRGSPYSEGGIDFIRFIKRLGFNIIQLGPQGQTTYK